MYCLLFILFLLIMFVIFLLYRHFCKWSGVDLWSVPGTLNKEELDALADV